VTEDREFLEILESYMQEETSAGGYVGKARFSLGYKAFLPGYSNEDSWWPYEAGNEGSKAEAMTKCKVAINESGEEGKRPQNCLGFILYKDSIKGREVSWQQDRYFTYAFWTDAARQIIMPKVKELGIREGEFWGRWTWTEDPSGRMETDAEGEPRVALIAYPVEVYKDEAEAEAAGGGGESIPATAPDWLKEIVDSLKADVESGIVAAALAAKYKVEAGVAANLLSGDKAVMSAAIAAMTGQSPSVVAGLL
jgi:hypothetical protein